MPIGGHNIIVQFQHWMSSTGRSFLSPIPALGTPWWHSAVSQFQHWTKIWPQFQHWAGTNMGANLCMLGPNLALSPFQNWDCETSLFQNWVNLFQFQNGDQK
jgi:hypothetical protein